MLNGLGGDWLGTKISVASLDSLVLVNRIQGIQDTECVYSVYAATKQTKSSTQLLAWYFRGSHSTILVFSNCLLSRPPSGSSRWNGVYFRRVRRGEVHWVHVHPPPPPGKKVPLRNVQKRRESSAQIYRQKKNVHVPLRYDKMKTKKVGKNKKIVNRKG